MPEELRNSLLMKNELSHGIEPDSSNLPLEVDNYHSLSLLEASSNHLPVPSTTCYKATHGQTGMKYCLRRYHGKWSRAVSARKSISLTPRVALLPGRIPDSIGEINDASRGRVEEVLASELRDAPRGLHHESFRRQLTHTRVRPARRLHDASLEILHTNYQRLRIIDGLSILRRRAAIQSQEHLAADWWEKTWRMFTPESLDHWVCQFRCFIFPSFRSQRPHSRGERNMECHYSADVRSSSHSSGQLGVQVWLKWLTHAEVQLLNISPPGRRLDPSKIITDDKRLRFSFVGITDIVSFDPNQQNPFQLVNHYQQVSDSESPWRRECFWHFSSFSRRMT